MIQLENKWLSISVSEETGIVNSIFDKQRNLEFIKESNNKIPFQLELSNGVLTHFEHFHAQEDQSGVILTWEITPLLKVIGKVQISTETNEIYFYSEVVNHSDNLVISLEYPILSDIGEITENGQRDYLAHSFATGVQIHNPMKNFTKEAPGFRYMPYPESFSGSSMQFFTYYGETVGGLYFAVYDGEGYSKWLNFYKNDQDFLEASFIHGCEDIGPQKGISVKYPVIIKTLQGDGWYEAADIYKTWAEKQFWCEKGKLQDIDDQNKSTWLLEEMGVSTFGINAGYDRSPWLRKFHEEMDTKMFHILGPDWVGTVQDFCNGVPGGHSDWFPTRFNPENLKVIESYGDKYAPFEFDYLFNINGADGECGKKALQQIPKSPTKSIDQYNFPFVCPADPFVYDLHVRRDEALQQEANVDSIYYDISANNIISVCMDESHGHTVGAGRQITMAYRKNYQDTKKAMMKTAGDKFIPMGTEMMNEVFLDVLDYYQARAGGQPAAPLETWNIKELMKSGEAELIPMFTYVYHEYGAVRLDGWGKLVKEIGELFYFTVARTYLWGGLYELNYEYSPMEAIDGKENILEEHYYPFEQREYSFDSERAKYLSKFAKLRTGIGNKYLAYGTMLRPLEFEREKVKLSWFLYNCAKDFKEYNDSGELSVDSIIHSAWQYRNESVGLFFANVHQQDQNIKLNLDLNQFHFKQDEVSVKIYNGEDVIELFVLKQDEERSLDITIPEKSVILLELT